MCSPKEYYRKKICTKVVSVSKNTLKKHPQAIFKKGGRVENPPPYRISSKPPSPSKQLPHATVLSVNFAKKHKILKYGAMVLITTGHII